MCTYSYEKFGYKVMEVPGCGFALLAWNREAQMWQQCTKYYCRFGNLRRYVKKHFGLNII